MFFSICIYTLNASVTWKELWAGLQTQRLLALGGSDDDFAELRLRTVLRHFWL